MTVAFIVGGAGCDAAATPTQCNLNISSIHGGEVTTTGQGIITCEAGIAIDLVVISDAGCRFVEQTGDLRIDPPSETTSGRIY